MILRGTLLMENKKKKKRQSNNALNLLLSICIVSLVISILCVAIVFVCFSRVDKRLSNLEAYLGMEKVSSKSKNASEEGEISKNLEYSTIYIEGIEINYPSSGSIGEKGFHRYESDPNEYFLDIESFEFTELEQFIFNKWIDDELSRDEHKKNTQTTL